MLRDILIYLCAAVIAVPLFKRLGLGAVLGYLVAGILIGPSVLKLIADPDSVLRIAELGVVLLLFLVGLELNPKKLWEMRISIFGMGAMQVFLTASAVAGALLLWGLDWKTALVIGIAALQSSTSVALALMSERNLLPTPGGRSALSVSLFQDIMVIPILLLLAAIAPAKTEAGHAPFNIWLGIALIAGFVVIARFAMRPLLRYIAGTGLKEVFIAFALLLVLGSAVAAESVGFSMALGTFLAGVLLAESEYRHELNLDIEPFKGLLLGLFFIAVGMSVQLNLFVDKPLLVLGGALALVVLKMLVLWLTAITFKLCGQDSLMFAILLSQVGEFAFVIITASQSNGLLPKPTADILNAIVAASILTTPFLFMAYNKFIVPRVNRAANRDADVIEERNAVIVAGFGRVGQVLARLLQARGHTVTLIDHDPNQIDLVRRFGFKAYYGDVSRLDVLEAAGISEAKLLILATDDMDATRETAKLVKERYAHVKLLARVRNRTDAFDMVELGVDFERETFRSAVRLGEKALVSLGEPQHQAARSAHAFIEHDEQMLLKGAAARHDQKLLIDIANRGRADLAALLTGEQAQAHGDTPEPKQPAAAQST
ncbi:MAG: monovalent cation:proton antiporter-2 (CPA2) family protein [Burkholderiaceae bacterium]